MQPLNALRRISARVVLSICCLAPVLISAAPSDFNGDGKSDLIWRHAATGSNAIWQIDGLNLVAGAYIPAVTDPNWTIAGIADFNGDGKADILWRNASTGDNAIWQMNGVALAQSALIGAVPDSNWKIVGVGDFDGNGRADILWRNSATGENAIWLMNGFSVASGAFIPTVADQNWAVAFVGDFNGDGKVDVLWRNSVTGDNALWQMNGTTLAAPGFLPAVPDSNWSIAAVGDLDGDGKADILWRNTNTGDNAIWLMTGLAIARPAFIDGVPDIGWNVLAVGDFNGDGKLDVAWRNTSTGENAIWLMEGTAIKASALLGTVGDIGWNLGIKAQIAETVTVKITEPADGAQITTTRLTVSGTVTGPPGTGVSVNGQPACVSNGKFFANDVPVTADLRTISANAVSPSGWTVRHTTSVLPLTPLIGLRIAGTGCGGPAPLDATYSFTAEGTELSELQSVQIDFDGDGTVDQTSLSSSSSVAFTYKQPGSYAARFTLVKTDGTRYVQTRIVQVDSSTQAQQIFDQVITGFRASLQKADVARALTYLTGGAQERYTPLLQQIRSKLPQLASSLTDMQPLILDSNYAEFAAVLAVDGERSGTSVILIKDANGAWKIDSM